MQQGKNVCVTVDRNPECSKQFQLNRLSFTQPVAANFVYWPTELADYSPKERVAPKVNRQPPLFSKSSKLTHVTGYRNFQQLTPYGICLSRPQPKAARGTGGIPQQGYTRTAIPRNQNRPNSNMCGRRMTERFRQTLPSWNTLTSGILKFVSMLAKFQYLIGKARFHRLLLGR